MSKEIDYDVPFVLDAVFREPATEEQQDAGERFGEERQEEVAALWFDIIGLRSYPFPDEGHWDRFAGPKFIITIREQGNFVVLGEFKHMLKLWKEYCKKYYGKDT